MFWLVLATSICSILGAGEIEEPKIRVDPKDYIGWPSDFRGLDVETSSGTGFKYRWHHNGNLINSKYKSSSFINWNTPRLIVNLKDNHQVNEYAGTYQFFMDTPVGSIASRQVKVEFTFNGIFHHPMDTNDVRDVVVGQATFIRCPKHDSGNHFIYKWGKRSGGRGTGFVAPSDNYIILNNGTLFFSHLKQRDLHYVNEFNMRCGMEAPMGKESLFTFSHIVKMKNVSQNFTKFGPRIVTELPVQTFSVGEAIYMKCAAAGNPLPIYSWKMVDSDGTEKTIVNGKDNYFYADGDSRILEIKATKKSAGNYTCTATIGQKSDSVQGQLIYEETPSWVSEKIKSVKRSIFSSHSWECIATGSPKPTYSWHANGTKLQDSLRHQISGGKITFPRLEKGDSGMYQCVAENSLNNVYQTAHLFVEATKPTFDENVGTTTLFLNSRGIINCSAKAAPPATNDWMKDGVVVDVTLPNYELVNNQHLVITKVSKADIGQYTCMAKNLYGKDTKTINVEVVGEIKFINEPKDHNITRGQPFQLLCKAEGEKTLAATILYKWRFNNEVLNTGKGGFVIWSLDTNTLYSFKATVSQSGKYECIAYINKPSYAEKIRTARIIVRGPPEQINTVKVEGGCAGFEAKVTWSVVGKSFDPIQYFIIEYSTSYEMDKWYNYTSRVPANRREQVVNKLSPYAKYRFRVLAVNSIGISENKYHTDYNQCVTNSAAPTICPKIAGVAGGDGELTINWEVMKLIDRNGGNFTYLVEYKKSSSKSWQNNTFNAVSHSFVVPNAGYYQRWNFRIRGVNQAGVGPSCVNDFYSGQNAPNVAPLNFHSTPGTDNVLLQWSPIILDRGSVDGYTVKYWQKPTVAVNKRRRRGIGSCTVDNPCTEDVAGSGKNSKKIRDLAPVQTYVMAIWGYNSGGSGPNASLEVMTMEGRPDAPDDVLAIAYARYIELRWKGPKKPNGIITGYQVTISNSTYTNTHKLKGEDRRFVFSGLVANTMYTVRVKAETERGHGPDVVKNMVTEKPAAPTQPKPPLAKGTGKDGVNVTFREGTPPKGFAESFRVVYRVKGSGNADVIETNAQRLVGKGSQYVIVITGLDVAQEYEFATIASNYFGDSQTSEFNATFPGTGAPETGARSSPIHKRSWFVAIVVLVCILLLILIIALLITRKRGERYPVGKREKKRAGILDVGEEGEANAYPMKPARDPANGVDRNGSKNSLPRRDPDGDSLDEYGEDRFGEDAASLIGEYNDDKKPNTVKYWQKPTVAVNKRRRRGIGSCTVDNPCTEDVAGSGKNSKKIRDLAPVQTYVMAIWGYNSGGSGPNASLEVMTMEGRPDAPDDVLAIAYARYIELRWKGPKKPNGIITGYQVTISNSTYTNTHKLKGEDRRFVFSGLVANTMYTVRVKAETERGHGPDVVKNMVTEKPAAPTQPKPPLAKGTGKDGVNVTFREGTPPKGFAESFRVVYRVKGSGNADVIETNAQRLVGKGSQYVIVITGLDVAQEYEFATIASNYFGDSQTSEFNATFPGTGAPETGARSSPIHKRSWFVAIVVLVCILLLILIIALLITRKRGERYPVGKREKKRAGILDVGEEGEANAYPMKPARDPANGVDRNGSKNSLPRRDPDGDSLDEYGEDRFGEDAASLIGEYNDDKKPNTVEGPAFV